MAKNSPPDELPAAKAEPPATHYAGLLADIKSQIRTTRVKAATAVNRRLIELYWEIGKSIVRRQEVEGWGKSVVERLSKDLKAEFPEMTGLSGLNLWRMRAFYRAWTIELENLSQPVTEMQNPNLRQPVAETSHGKLQQPVGETVASKLPQAVTETQAVPEPLASIPWGLSLIHI